MKIDGLVKSQEFAFVVIPAEFAFVVIPAKAGIQSFQ